MSEPLIQARSMSSGYHQHPVVRDLDLEVHPGEVVALLGANGAGKTTTLMTLAGQLRPLGGTVMFDGAPVRPALHRQARSGLAYVTEQRSVFMRLTVADNLRLGRGDDAIALEIFPELEPLLGRLAGQLSGGEQQILTLARALSRRPRLLLADELSLGLAPKIVVRLLAAVRAAADRGVGVLLVEQHVHQALRYADRAYVLNRGSLVLSGPISEIADRVEDAYLSGETPIQAAGPAAASPVS
jgi:branched-chain amino acid transport system ATP-binding protein